MNIEDKSEVNNIANWSVFFGIGLWRIWYWRNQFVFNQTSTGSGALMAEMCKIQNHPLVTGKIRAAQWIRWIPQHGLGVLWIQTGLMRLMESRQQVGWFAISLVVGSQVLEWWLALVLLCWLSCGAYIRAPSLLTLHEIYICFVIYFLQQIKQWFYYYYNY